MNDQQWILLDTETTGFVAPVYVVELAARRMRGWVPEGPPFRRLLNQNADIPSEASRVHGYTREILERDGEPAATVYRDFAAYVAGFPLVAYNRQYDLDEVLEPEWIRLGLQPFGTPGFCALRLAQRLLDPVPAGNCKLQTLRQFYRLPERGAHTALGDVDTVADLMATVLRPIAESRGLHSWEQVCQYTQAEWFPSRIAFGKFKGRSFHDATHDVELRAWLEWLTRSSSPRSANMGRWYLGQVAVAAAKSGAASDAAPVADVSPSTAVHQSTLTSTLASVAADVMIFADPQMLDLKRLVEAARSRLADLEVEYTAERHAVEVTQSLLFGMLRAAYQRRDRVSLVVAYRRKFLEALIHGGEEDADAVTRQCTEALSASDAEYDEAAGRAEGCTTLGEEDERELKALWRKLVRLYHPDRFVNDARKREAFELLTSEINRARDESDIERLREIADDPGGFMSRRGWGSLNFDDTTEIVGLRKLFDSLQSQTLTMIEKLSDFRESAAYDLHRLITLRSGYLSEVAAEHAKAIAVQTAELDIEAATLADEIKALTAHAGMPSEPENSSDR